MAKHSTIPGVERANFLIDGLHDFQERQGETDISLLTVAIEAQVQATLALVEQQRLASLIAWEAVTGEKNRAVIRHGLGLWEPDPKDIA